MRAPYDRLDFLRKIVPDAQSLTKVKLLDVTIEYIAQLKERLGLRSPVDDGILQLLSDDKVRNTVAGERKVA